MAYLTNRLPIYQWETVEKFEARADREAVNRLNDDEALEDDGRRSFFKLNIL